MKYVLKFLLMTSLFLLFASIRASANDPAQEFSIAKNPNGVWSYGFTPTLGGAFALADTAKVNFMWQQ